MTRTVFTCAGARHGVWAELCNSAQKARENAKLSDEIPETAQGLEALARELRFTARQELVLSQEQEGVHWYLAEELLTCSRMSRLMASLLSSCARIQKRKEQKDRKALTAFQWRLDQLQRKERPQTVLICNACTRRGTLCQMRCVSGRARCRMHGGLSTGPTTDKGRAAIIASNKRRAVGKSNHGEHGR